MTFIFEAMPTDYARKIQNGGLDVHGQKPDRTVSDGQGNPCRHCLKQVPEGRGMLILAYKPFSGTNAYTETGPIFLCEDECARHQGDSVPEITKDAEAYLMRGYNEDERIVYGAGDVIAKSDMASYANSLFENPEITEIHVRSKKYNCFQFKIKR